MSSASSAVHSCLMGFALLACLFLSACAAAGFGSGQGGDTQAIPTPESLFEDANAALEKRDFVQAAKLFEDIEHQHPYSRYAASAQLLAARAYYEAGRYDEAVLAADRFIALHPGSADLDQAHYLRAIAFYDQISDVRRDQHMSLRALESLESLIARFPHSSYARDARLKRDLVLDHLAGKEMEIGRYYLGRGEVNAAINRFRVVVESYQTTAHIPEALHRLVEAYMLLGLKTEARRVAAVLGHNYPGSSWYADTYALMDPDQRQRMIEERSWVDRTTRSLFRAE